MDDHELLIRHALVWAEKRRRPLDRGLLETVVTLRGFHDELSPQEWPLGSAEHLMLVRWPSHGPSEPPDVDALVQTLDSYWRFLRGTGRMSSVSADPKALLKEARRSAAGMRAACTDPTRHSASKSLLQFGESIGLSLEEASSVEEVNERLQQIMDAWNALPEEQRRTLSPGESAHQGSLPGMSATQLIGSVAHDEGDPDVDLPQDEHGNVPFADLAEVAAQVRASPFVQQCRRLVEWVGEGRPVTPNQVLRLAPAREAYDALDLWAWERTQQRLGGGGHHVQDQPLEAEDLLRQASRESFRSSADCRALDRLWLACHEVELLEVGRTKAVSAWREPATDEDWQLLGTALVGSLLVHMPPSHLHQVVGTLLHLLDPARDRIPLTELETWWWRSRHNVYRSLEERAGESLRPDSDRWFRAALHELDDTGVWRREGEVLHATALGHDVALIAVHLLEEGLIEQ